MENQSFSWSKVVFVLLGLVALTAIGVSLSMYSPKTDVSAKDSDNQTINDKSTVLTLRSDDWVRGDRDAKAIVIEYSDFECPACSYYYTITKQIEKDMGSKVAIVYRHFPLTSIHRNAQPAAVATEAAGLQGKFWEMHDMLFEKQSEWSALEDTKTIFTQYAKKLGLKTDEFAKALDSTDLKNKVEASYNEAIELELPGTPSFFLNGKEIAPSSVDEFKRLITESIS